MKTMHQSANVNHFLLQFGVFLLIVTAFIKIAQNRQQFDMQGPIRYSGLVSVRYWLKFQDLTAKNMTADHLIKVQKLNLTCLT